MTKNARQRPLACRGGPDLGGCGDVNPRSATLAILVALGRRLPRRLATHVTHRVAHEETPLLSIGYQCAEADLSPGASDRRATIGEQRALEGAYPRAPSACIASWRR